MNERIKEEATTKIREAAGVLEELERQYCQNVVDRSGMEKMLGVLPSRDDVARLRKIVFRLTRDRNFYTLKLFSLKEKK